MTVALPNFKMQVRLIATWQVGSQPPVSGLAISCQGSRFDLLGRTKHIVPQWYGIYIDIPYDILIRITSYTFMYHDIMINTNIYIYIYTNMYVYIYIIHIIYTYNMVWPQFSIRISHQVFVPRPLLWARPLSAVPVPEWCAPARMRCGGTFQPMMVLKHHLPSPTNENMMFLWRIMVFLAI